MHIEDWHTVDQILAMAQARISSEEPRGGDAAAFARTDRKILQDHRPSGGRSDPCMSCGQPWPCGFIRTVIEWHE